MFFFFPILTTAVLCILTHKKVWSQQAVSVFHKDEEILTTKLLSLGLDVSVIPSLILSFRSDTFVSDILPWGKIHFTEI